MMDLTVKFSHMIITYFDHIHLLPCLAAHQPYLLPLSTPPPFPPSPHPTTVLFFLFRFYMKESMQYPLQISILCLTCVMISAPNIFLQMTRFHSSQELNYCTGFIYMPIFSTHSPVDRHWPYSLAISNRIEISMDAQSIFVVCWLGSLPRVV